MALDFEFLSPTDKPALLALTSPDLHAAAKVALNELGYKAQSVATHDEFQTRSMSVQYQLILIEDSFASLTSGENTSLRMIQDLPMALRRHATFILVGSAFQTMNTMQAFRQSVHAVVNPADASKLKPILQQVAADNAVFMTAYWDIQNRIAQGKS